jgi:hypothetical protein
MASALFISCKGRKSTEITNILILVLVEKNYICIIDRTSRGHIMKQMGKSEGLFVESCREG